MVTEKFNHMLENFNYSFSLSLKGDCALSELEKQIKQGNHKLLRDVKLLGELTELLKSGKAEIHILKQCSHCPYNKEVTDD